MMRIEWWDWTGLGDEEGRVDRPAAVPTWSAAPEVEFDGQWLLFRYPIRTLRPGRRGLQYRKVEAAAALLTEFVQLDEAPAERILDYARRHGRFGFCKHGDLSHRLRPEGCSADVCTTGAGQTAVREALQWWRSLASHARALLNVAAQLSKGRVEDLTLARLNPQLCFSAPRLRAARRAPASFVAYGIELWLRFFQVRPRVSYNQRRKRFEIRISGTPPLPGALALQIMLAVTRSAGVAICSSCGKPFAPSRRPNSNRDAYCKACGIRAAWREAQARRRARKLTDRKGGRTKRRS
jgi:hypothetical protein